MLGLCLLPIALLHPTLRRHVWRVPHPVPGWTWIHGASHGEHQAARPLAAVLTTAWRTSSSPRTPVRGAFPAPADLPFVADTWLARARPGRLILIEGELWPGWLVSCRRRGIPVTVVQARPSRGWQRWQRTGPIWRWLMAGVTVIPQSEVGDLKLVRTPPAPVRPLPPGAVIVASSRPGDEAWVLGAWTMLPSPRPLLVIAPRHLNRCDEVEALVTGQGLSVARRSKGDDARAVDVLLLDTFGELASLFEGARVVIIGGTLDPKIGGHSPAEAVQAGLPVVGGPHRHANPAAWQVARCFSAAPTPDALLVAITKALDAPRATPPPTTAVTATIARLPASHLPDATTMRPWLWPLVPLVHGVGRLRTAWRGQPIRLSVPVVSVGGITAGGAGKTPLAAWIARQVPGAWVVARGYRRGPGPAIRVGHPDRPSPHPLGDELEMLRRRGIPVVSAPDRVAGARMAIKQGARCIVLDDGFQHRRLHRDVDLVCLDARWPDGGGLIPVGTAREPWSALRRADVVVVMGGPVSSTLVDRPVVTARLVPAPTVHLPAELDVALGIARPSGILCTLVSRGHTIRSLRLVADHGSLPPLPTGCVVSEKDAARLPPDSDVQILRAILDMPDPTPIHAALRAAGIPVPKPTG